MFCSEIAHPICILSESLFNKEQTVREFCFYLFNGTYQLSGEFWEAFSIQPRNECSREFFNHGSGTATSTVTSLLLWQKSLLARASGNASLFRIWIRNIPLSSSSYFLYLLNISLLWECWWDLILPSPKWVREPWAMHKSGGIPQYLRGLQRSCSPAQILDFMPMWFCILLLWCLEPCSLLPGF